MSKVLAVNRRNFAASIPGASVMLIVLTIVFAFVSPDFATRSNLTNILAQSTILLVVALPMTLVILTEGLDLSVGAVASLASMVIASVAVVTGSLSAAIGAGLLVGLGFGLANGGLIAVLGIPPFVATLGTLGAAQGLALVISDGQSVTGFGSDLSDLYYGSIGPLALPIIYSVLLYLAFHWLLDRSRFGVAVRALGGNRQALALSGRSVRLPLIAVYGLSSVMAGFTALLMTSRMNAGHPTAGLGLEFDAIAAVALGGTSFERGHGWLAGTLLGVLTISILRNGITLLSIPAAAQVTSVGLMVIIAMIIDRHGRGVQ
ncbi:ABC transporter permease [Bradyrhizobium prioriisuperbiae]|uniref:ABC transporter permease n=1 Tax=Bradyrhizobium prioriisuperbiae TaxID=2854389 RepID=UPI0028E8D9C4|nr:ABC transporter permease [Bradyrhizobium prioritasuperba]